MRMSKFSRTSAAVLSAALLATACSSDDPTTTDDGTDVEAPETDGPTASGDGYDWSDVNRRLAISMAIDRQEIVDVIFNGTQLAADNFWPATFAGEASCENMAFNPEKAKQLWDEAGGDAGPITMWFNSGAGHEDWVEAAANMLKTNLGVADVQFQSMEFADYLDKMDNAEVDGPFRLGWGMDYPSPGNFLAVLHGTEGGYNRTGYSNPAFDEVAAAGDALPLAEALPFYEQAADILCADMPIAPMRFGALQGVWSENVAGVQFDAFDRLILNSLEDVDGDGEISMYVCEPQAQLAGPINNDSCGNEVLNALFTGLVSLDRESGELVNEVAESIETSDDGTNWTVKLKEGWTFHDGTAVTASSFVDAWNWGAYGPNGAKNSYYYSIPQFAGYSDLQAEEEGATPAAAELSGLTVVSDNEFTIELDAPFAQLPLLFLHGSFSPLPKAFFDGEPEAFGENPIGNGPFKMSAPWEHDVQIATEAFADYKGAKPSFSKMTFKIFSEVDTAYNELRANGLDIMDTVPAAELANYQDEFAGRFVSQSNTVLQYLGFPIDLELVSEWSS